MENILNFIKNNWLLLSVATFFLSWFAYLTFSGNQFCDCAKTETYRDGTTRSSTHRTSFYRYYHK